MRELGESGAYTEAREAAGGWREGEQGRRLSCLGTAQSHPTVGLAANQGSAAGGSG